jgi:hypothetical protein
MVLSATKISDGRDHLLGRLASVVAKELLSGQSIVIVRCDEVAISGSCELIMIFYSDWFFLGETRFGILQMMQRIRPQELSLSDAMPRRNYLCSPVDLLLSSVPMILLTLPFLFLVSYSNSQPRQVCPVPQEAHEHQPRPRTLPFQVAFAYGVAHYPWNAPPEVCPWTRSSCPFVDL